MGEEASKSRGGVPELLLEVPNGEACLVGVECYRKWEKPKDPSEVDREDMNEGHMPRRSGGGRCVTPKMLGGDWRDTRWRGSNHRERNNFKASVCIGGALGSGSRGLRGSRWQVAGLWQSCGREAEWRGDSHAVWGGGTTRLAHRQVSPETVFLSNRRCGTPGSQGTPGAK